MHPLNPIDDTILKSEKVFRLICFCQEASENISVDEEKSNVQEIEMSSMEPQNFPPESDSKNFELMLEDLEIIREKRSDSVLSYLSNTNSTITPRFVVSLI